MKRITLAVVIGVSMLVTTFLTGCFPQPDISGTYTTAVHARQGNGRGWNGTAEILLTQTGASLTGHVTSLSSRHHWLESFFAAAVVGSHSILVLQTSENVRQHSPKAPKLNMPCTTGPAPRRPADPKRDSPLRCRGRRPSNYQSVRHLFRALRVMAISTLSRKSLILHEHLTEQQHTDGIKCRTDNGLRSFHTCPNDRGTAEHDSSRRR